MKNILRQALTAVLNSTEYRLGHPGYEHTAANLTAAIDAAEKQEPVGKIVTFGGPDTKEVAWIKGKMPPTGTDLYTNPAPTQSDSAQAKDAARYRYMRNNAQFQSRNGPGLYWYLPRNMSGDKGEQLDAAIDAAMKVGADKTGDINGNK